MLEGSILQTLGQSHQPGQPGKRPLNFGVYYKNTLVALCHALEDAVLSSSSSPLMVTAFQRGKWYLQEAERYAEIAQCARQIVILASPDTGFVEHPTSQMPNVSLVGLEPGDPVAQEWHLMILSPSYAAMVLCQELSAADYGTQKLPTEDRERKFYGFWTFEANLVQETMELAIAHVGRYDPELQAQLTEQLQAIATEAQTAVQDELGPVVTRVIDYLQHSQQDLNLPLRSQRAVSLGQPILDNNLVSNEIQACLRMAQLTDQADTLNPNAAAEVAALTEAISQLLDLPVWQVNRLRLAGLLHRLAPLQRDESRLSAGVARYSDTDTDEPPSCPLVPGAQVLRTMSRLRAIATIITHQTEWWNGSGQPAGLAGDEIPLESRILGLVVAFQQNVTQCRVVEGKPIDVALTEALSVCQTQQGVHWDPKLVDTLELLVNGLCQGLSLPAGSPKIAAGMWLLDSHCEEDLLGFYTEKSGVTINRP
ncbi:MAG: metal-dependent phosphohydrolase [Scytolyngbya sp. HA4215-MV1]|jgi:DICT domain-containing protein|nr:metal-dependent phosphohydrolase [Scytolyngbya sp. HA4215-MV1]